MASPDEGGGDQQPPAPPLTVGHHTTSRQPLSHMQLHLAAAFGLATSPTIARSLSPTAVPSPTTPGDDLQPLYPSHATLQPPHSHHPHQIPLITSPSQTCVSNPGQSHASHHHQPPPTICCLPSFPLVKTAAASLFGHFRPRTSRHWCLQRPLITNNPSLQIHARNLSQILSRYKPNTDSVQSVRGPTQAQPVTLIPSPRHHMLLQSTLCASLTQMLPLGPLNNLLMLLQVYLRLLYLLGLAIFAFFIY